MNTRRIPRPTIANARHLRKQQTEPEKTLWNLLRRRQLLGYYFRRQSPIGQYIADFVCLEKRLIIELDGGQHQTTTLHDAQRTKQLESKGFRVIRFWNNELQEDPDAVLQAILIALEQPPEKSPLPSITTTVHGGMFRDARRAARRLA